MHASGLALLNIFFFCLLLYSSEELVCTGRHGNSMCAVCSPSLSLSVFLSGVFALPFTLRHLLPWGLTRQKQEMLIMLTVMLINAKTLDVQLIIANGPVGLDRNQLILL